jgi:hypothetical protein
MTDPLGLHAPPKPWPFTTERRHPALRTRHGRVEVRHLHAFLLEPLGADFPFARTLIVLRSERTLKETGVTTVESRY